MIGGDYTLGDSIIPISIRTSYFGSTTNIVYEREYNLDGAFSYIKTFIAEDNSINMYIAVPPNTKLSNAKFIITLKDLSIEKYTNLDLYNRLDYLNSVNGQEFDLVKLAVDGVSLISGTGVYYNGNGQTSNSTVSSHTGFIDVTKYDKLRFTVRTVPYLSSYGYAFYKEAVNNKDDNRVGGDIEIYSEVYGIRIITVTVPPEAKYFRTTWFKSDSEFYNEFSVIGVKIGTIQETINNDKQAQYYIEYDNIRNVALNRYVEYYSGFDRQNLYKTNPSLNYAASVNINRYKTFVKLNYNLSGEETTNNQTKRIKLSGSLSRSSGTSTFKNWTPDLYLKAGQTYKLSIKKISGDAIYNDNNNYLPWCALYKSGGSAISTTIIFSSEEKGEKLYKFTGIEEPVSLGLGFEGDAILKDFLIDVVLYEYDEEDAVDDYFYNEMNDTISKTRNSITEPSLVFLWTTDIHRHSSNAAYQNFDSMITNMSNFVKQVSCDFLLNTGDLTDGNTVQATTLTRAYDCLNSFMSIGIPYVWAQGNHDTNYAVSGHPYEFTMKECFKAYFSSIKNAIFNMNEQGTEFYIDFVDLDTRVISLNANNCTTHVEYAFGNSTQSWLSNALQTDKKILLFMHQTPYTNHTYNNATPTDTSSGVKTVLNNFVNNGGNLIMLSGHSHLDMAFIDPWLSIMQDCTRAPGNEFEVDSINPSASPSGPYIDVVRKCARTRGTPTQDLWSVCIFKPFSNDLDIIRFGAGKDRYFHNTPITEATTLTTRFSGTVTWSSSNTEIATVSDNGEITFVATGKCAIIAKDEEENYECWVVKVG